MLSMGLSERKHKVCLPVVLCGDIRTRTHEEDGEVLVSSFRRDMKRIKEAVLFLASVEVAPLCFGLT